MRAFHLPAHAFTSVTIRKEWSRFRHKETLTEEELVKVLKGEDRCSSVHSEDHPEFAALRDKLEEQGFIKTQRNCWNGDTVLRPFSLNRKRFKKGDRFVSASPMKYELRKYLK